MSQNRGALTRSMSHASAGSPAKGDDDDPVLDAFLAFLEEDMRRRPDRLELLSAGSIARAVELTDDIAVSDDEIFPDDVTI